MKNTSMYSNSIKYIETNDTLKSEIGQIKYYGFFVSGNAKGNGTGKLYIDVIGDKKTVQTQVKIENIDGTNRVTEFKYK